jgi:hypothetical protein
MIKFILTVKKQGFFIGYVSTRGVAVQMYVDRYGRYTTIAIDHEGASCIIDSGEHLHLAFTRKANATRTEDPNL